MKIIIGVIIVAVSLGLSAGMAHAQSPLQFNSISVTEEGAIRLDWQSESNTVYRVDYADQIVDPDLGSIVWHTLHDWYPSQGSNTYWLDTGDYFRTPAIPHPKYATNRFYRIFNEGLNSGEAPTVTITSPTNGATLSGLVTVSVTATTSYPLVSTGSTWMARRCG